MQSGRENFYINNFDFIRLITATMVLVNHSFAHLKLPVPGWYTIIQQFQPVPMFFVMSGFLISASLERNGDLNQYFTNRITRIFPGLWVCLLLTVIIFSSIGGVNFFRGEAVPWFVAQSVGFIYTPSFLDHFGYGSYNGSLWTLVIELQFYLLLPVLYLAQKRLHAKKGRYFVILFGVALVVAFIVRLPYVTSVTSLSVQKIARYALSSHAYLFFAGVLMQRYRWYDTVLIRGKAIYWAIAYLIVANFLAPSHLWYVIAMLMLAIFTISLAYTLPGFASKWLGKTDISYGLFLYHGVPLTLLVEWKFLGNIWYMAIVGVITLLLAWLSNHFVETPSMEWAKKKNIARKEKLSKISTYAPQSLRYS